MSAFGLPGYSLMLGDHETGIWCRTCTGCITGADGMHLSFNCDRKPLTIADLAAAAQAHHEQHHRAPHLMDRQVTT